MAVRGTLFTTGKHGSTQKSRQLDSEVPWPQTYTTIGQIPRAWLCSFLQHAEPSFSDPVLAKINEKSGETIKRLIYMGCGVHDGSPLPKECLNKPICSQWFMSLYESLGRRFSNNWVGNFVGSSGDVDWQRGGV